ncbi:hypothetical protein T458_14245 [Brevibacillus panacihumi W25]|uniref:Uncharacterized protein n=1 Tax=Brevibacillus panacihumi W25 TaxID=1408254 RepID=V6M7T6_9BACL|nr:hypothetical protein T458_14245 [Brevibacillus panacihumi W25]
MIANCNQNSAIILFHIVKRNRYTKGKEKMQRKGVAIHE